MLKNLKQFNAPEIEEKVLEYWRVNGIFEKSLKNREKGKEFIFYEGPPYANGKPGIHHVLARVFKDIVLRYKTMQGYYVPRRAGWDTHGLPIELEAERQLGIKTKRDIEKFGLHLFNQKARESIWAYKGEWEKMTERIGYWLDVKNAYITYTSDYIESLWWIFSEIAKKKLLRKDYKVLPYCPRCQTVLASHELGQPGVYKKTKDPSVYVKFKVNNPTTKTKPEFLLVWTTTPWTLPANVAVAVNPKLTYTKYKVGKEYIWSLVPPPMETNDDIEPIEKLSGKKLVGLRYEPLYPVMGQISKVKGFYEVKPADFVSEEEGTGFVHIAPAFGEDDFTLMRSEIKGFSYKDVPVTVDDVGKVVAGYPGAGKFVKEADKDIVADLTERGLMHKAGTAEHDYPFCWRCSTPLLYFARTAWFVEMSKLRGKLVTANKKINWIPTHIKEGRFGEWIKEAKDWAISRQRYWGAPLPIWECDKCDERVVAGSRADLDAHAYTKNTFLLLRHTEAEHNVKDIIASGPKGKQVPLTEKGKRDAEKLATKLARRNIDIIYASPYKRTQDTAQTISKKTGAKIVTDKHIEELNCGIFNNLPPEEYRKFFKEPIEQFTKTPPGGESLTDVRRRMFAFIRDTNKAHNGKTILVVSHGDPLWVLDGAMKNIPNENMFSSDYIHVGEFREASLHNWPYDADGNLDMHRPYIDEVYLKCKKCKGKMERVREIADVWFDSGAMPFASTHYPFVKKLAYPADFIAEGTDQTRGWFYTLLSVAILVGQKAPPYKNAISLGLINDKHGQKMSKSRGNTVNPWEIFDKYGVDAVRWYFYTVNSPGENKNFDEIEIKKTANKIINILYNSYVFYATYAKPITNNQLPITNNVLDKWILARLNEVVAETTAKLETYDIGGAAKEIEGLIDDLSRWYIRRSRRRLQKSEDKKDYEMCSAVLGHVIRELATLMAPFTPFFAEALYQSLAKDSVHLADWPKTNKKLVDVELLQGMATVRDIATKALAKRAEAGIKVRQPLQKLKIKNQKIKISEELLEILKDEINVKEVVFDKGEGDIELDTHITPELREEGVVREFTRAVQELRQKAGLEPKDKIFVYVSAEGLADVLGRHEALFKREVGAEKLHLKHTAKLDAELTSKVEGKEIWVGIKKV